MKTEIDKTIAVSPTTKSLKIRSDSANNATEKQLPPE